MAAVLGSGKVMSNGMNELFTAALGLASPWQVSAVRFEQAANEIHFDVRCEARRLPCPRCGAEDQPIHDRLARDWQHLHFFQFRAFVHAEVPRVRCAVCGERGEPEVHQVSVPWARERSGFTLLMEALVVTLVRMSGMPVRQDGHWVRGYAPAGMTPELRMPAGRHAATTMISAITNQGLVRFRFFEGALDTDRFIGFLQGLIDDAQRKVFLIVDNLKVHHAKPVKAWLAERTDRIEVFYLPSYSPDLNPDEYLNRDLKTTLRQGPVAKTTKALAERARLAMEAIAAMPERVRSYFSHESVRYAI
jgi:transposase